MSRLLCEKTISRQNLNTNALRGFNEIQHFDYFLWQNVNNIV
jgi:hypothetical protein